ncbi:hypothetical protein HNR71_005888 [Kribbella sandramycini]|uniref:Uncharacterized protein n=1 Tax=Kribbella sandramycini TaxID=60450 RepID=A0A841SJV0_9ACTN|nr:hypothetical protein [Kribbella sandramycini]
MHQALWISMGVLAVLAAGRYWLAARAEELRRRG